MRTNVKPTAMRRLNVGVPLVRVIVLRFGNMGRSWSRIKFIASNGYISGMYVKEFVLGTTHEAVSILHTYIQQKSFHSKYSGTIYLSMHDLQDIPSHMILYMYEYIK
jgi:hypothetical protein